VPACEERLRKFCPISIACSEAIVVKLITSQRKESWPHSFFGTSTSVDRVMTRSINPLDPAISAT
jgi:hypothetical protein